MAKIEFYKDPAKRLIQPNLFSDQAESLAKTIAEQGRDRQGKLSKNKRSQIRKFYDDVLRLKAESESEPWDNIAPYVNMLNAKAAYAYGRDYVTEDFLNFIKVAVVQVKRQEDIEVFSGFFEAFMGYYRMYGD